MNDMRTLIRSWRWGRPRRSTAWYLTMALARVVGVIGFAAILPWWGAAVDTPIARTVSGVNLCYGLLVLVITLHPDRWRFDPFWPLLPIADVLTLEAALLATGGAHSPFHWAILMQVLAETFMFGAAVGASSGLALMLLLGTLDALAQHPFAADDFMLAMMTWSGYASFVYLNDTTRRATHEAKVQMARAQELQALNEAKYQFINIVSHELRTPLTVINGYSKLLQSQTVGADLPERLEVAQEISRAADRMGLLIEELLDFGRLQSGQLPMRPEHFELAKLVQDVVNVLGVLAAQKEQRITLASRAADTWIEADPRRLDQVLINLLHNALKYSPEKSEVQVIVRAENRRVRVEICDCGPGIALEHQAHLFTPFFRAGLGIHRVDVEGVGLGLAICRGIVQAHDGAIGVESTPGNGCCFWFELPSAKAVAPELFPVS